MAYFEQYLTGLAWQRLADKSSFVWFSGIRLVL
jgi:hypothetical protein